MTRAMKAVKASGVERARIVMDLAKQQIEVIIGESEAVPTPGNPWDDEKP